MIDLINLKEGTEFYLPPVRGFWSGKTYLKKGELWVEVIGLNNMDFKLTKGKYIVDDNIKLCKMPSYHLSKLSYADY